MVVYHQLQQVEIRHLLQRLDHSEQVLALLGLNQLRRNPHDLAGVGLGITVRWAEKAQPATPREIGDKDKTASIPTEEHWARRGFLGLLRHAPVLIGSDLQLHLKHGIGPRQPHVVELAPLGQSKMNAIGRAAQVARRRRETANLSPLAGHRFERAPRRPRWGAAPCL